MDDPARESGARAFAPTDHHRLWTPWRMRYVGGQTKEVGCIFCNRLASNDDIRSLILHRGEHSFAIMNLYPYNTGHIMLVPNDHISEPEAATPGALAEMATLLPTFTRALRRVLNCDGFNIGMNIGAVAGAGVADHLHQHIVPRWTGDANFMPIIASTMVIPELMPATYAKIRAELSRELAGHTEVTVVLLAHDDTKLLRIRDATGWRLPTAAAESDEPVWRAAHRAVDTVPGVRELVGWAGPTASDQHGPAALTLRAHDPNHEMNPTDSITTRSEFADIDTALSDLTSHWDRDALRSAFRHMAPSIELPGQ